VNVLKIDLPPLRERLDDLPLLIEQFLGEDPLARQFGATRVSDDVLVGLQNRAWPGNVRELRNTLRRSVVFGTEGGILRRLWEDSAEPSPARAPALGLARPSRVDFRAWLREQERKYLAELIERHAGIAQQMRASGLPQRTLYRKLRALGLRSPLRSVGSAPEEVGRCSDRAAYEVPVGAR